MAKNVYKIEWSHMICDSFYLEAESKEEAEKLFSTSVNDLSPEETEMIDSDAEKVVVTLHQDWQRTGYLYDVDLALSDTRKKLLEIIEEQYDAGARIPDNYRELPYYSDVFMGDYVGDSNITLRRNPENGNHLEFAYYDDKFNGEYKNSIDLTVSTIPIECLLKLASEMK